MVKKYKRSDKLQLAKNFRLDEFKCKCGKCDPILVDEALVDWLQKIRDHFGRSVNINSGYRCEKHNADPKVGGSPGSHHVKGMAADIRVEGVTPEEVAKYAESIGIQRIGLYDTFVHIGSDSKKRFWLGHEGKEVDTFTKTVTLKLPVLKKGSRGDSVMALQAMLEVYGYEDRGNWGIFDNATEAALKEYQLDCELAVDGSCGKATWTSLLGGAVMQWLSVLLGGSMGSALVAGVFTLLQWKLSREAAREDRVSELAARESRELKRLVGVLVEADRTLLYDRIKHLGKAYIARGYITVEELEDLDLMHEVYHNKEKLGGNGFLDALMKTVHTLEVRAT